MNKTRTAILALLVAALAAIILCGIWNADTAFAETYTPAESDWRTADYPAAGSEGWFALIGTGALICIMAILKFAAFNRHRLKVEANAAAAKSMDPLLVGKLIDNKAHDGDVAALIFYWANGGFVKLDMSGKRPIVTKLKSLPAMAPAYEQKLFYGIFKRRDVFVFEGESLFNVAVAVKKTTDEKTRGCFSSASIGFSVLFAILCGATLGLYPMLYAINYGVSSQDLVLTGFVFLLPALIAYGLSESLLYNKFKLGIKGKSFYMAIIAAICAGGTAVYALVIPDYVFALAPKILIAVLAFAGSALSAALIERTENYNKKLSEILSLRTFILDATEPEMRDLMKDEPDLFVKIYPYAYVLNIGDVWAARFTNTRIKAPAWCERAGEILQGAAGLNGAMDAAAAKIASSFVARPAHERPEQ